jgi:hypothetical protein
MYHLGEGRGLRGQALDGAAFAEALRRLQVPGPGGAAGSLGRMVSYETTPCDPTDDCAAPAAAQVPKAHLPGLPHVRRLGTATDAAGRRTALLAEIGYDWHVDSIGAYQTALYCPPGGALSRGGETLLCSAAAAYDALGPAQRARAEALVGVYSNRYTGGGPSAYDSHHGLRLDPTGTMVVAEATSRRPSWSLGETSSALVRRHSETGRRYRPGPPGRLTPLAFAYVNRFSMVLLYGRTGCLTAKSGGFRPGQSPSAAAGTSTTSKGWARPRVGAPSARCCSPASAARRRSSLPPVPP